MTVQIQTHPDIYLPVDQSHFFQTLVSRALKIHADNITRVIVKISEQNRQNLCSLEIRCENLKPQPVVSKSRILQKAVQDAVITARDLLNKTLPQPVDDNFYIHRSILG